MPVGVNISEWGVNISLPMLWDCSLEAVASGSTRGHSDPSRGSFGALRGAGAPAGRIRPNRYKYASESACATGCLSRPPERIGAAPGAPMVYGSRITRFQPQTGIVHTCIYRLFTADLQSCRDCSALEANLTQIKIFSRASPKLTGQLVCELGMVGQALLTLFE